MVTAGKKRIENEEQIRRKKRKRQQTDDVAQKKGKLDKLKTIQGEVKAKDKELEKTWSAINVEAEQDLLSMGLVSLEVMEEDDIEAIIERPGKRKKKTAPKTDPPPKNITEELKKPVGKESNTTSSCVAGGSTKLSFAEKKEKLKQKRKEKIAKAKLKRMENPDEETELKRKLKLKEKRKAKRKKKMEEKQLKSEMESFIAEKGTIDCSAGSLELQKSDVVAKCENVPVSGDQREDVPVSEDQEDSSKVESLEDVPIGTSAEEVPELSENGTMADSCTEDGTKCDGENSVELEDKVEPVVLTEEEKEAGKKWLELDICDELVKGLLSLSFTKPTPIQQACIPAGLLKYKDVIGAAETGSGKTLAFGIPLIQRVMQLKSEKCVKGLVLCPTRELALQVTDHLVAVSKYTGVRIVPIVGGIAAPKQERLLSYHPPILVATPGRLWQLIQEHPYLQNLDTIRFLVVDEADRMVEDGHFEEMNKIIGRIPDKDHRNTFLFSATLAFTIDRLDDKAKNSKTKKLSKKEKKAEKKGTAGLEMLVRNIGVKDKVEKVDFTLKKGTAEMLTETYFLSNIEDKDVHLFYLLLNHPGKTLVFANSIDGVMNLVHIMKLLQVSVFPLHSSLQQRQRFKFLDRFKETANAVLICTDIAARGLDIPDVDVVVHYQLPPTREAYIHRSGRTARAENPGLSVAMVGPKDFKSYKKVCSQMSEFPIEQSRLKILRPTVDLAKKIFKIERLKTRPQMKEAKLVQLAKEAGLEEKEVEEEENFSKETKREVKIMKAQLKQLLSLPVKDPENSTRYAGTVGAFETISTFSLGVSALEHSKKKGKKI